MVDLCWYDTAIDSTKLCSMKRFQRVNHFPAMHGIAKKSELATILKKIKGNFSQDYHFFPKSWNLPNQINRLQTEFLKNKKKGLPPPVYIIKPSDSA